MDNSDSRDDVSVSERRTDERRVENREVRLTVRGLELSGHSRDISDSSLFLLTEGELRTTVHFTDGEDDSPPREGRLIRYQRMPDGGSGWAIEFDD